jgi:hypothetical protein
MGAATKSKKLCGPAPRNNSIRAQKMMGIPSSVWESLTYEFRMRGINLRSFFEANRDCEFELALMAGFAIGWIECRKRELNGNLKPASTAKGKVVA